MDRWKDMQKERRVDEQSERQKETIEKETYGRPVSR
jgi:hypothetical protein